MRTTPGTIVPLPDNIRSVQPGGGVCYRLELLWGRWRRWWLRTFRRGYVTRMAELRRGSTEGAPHEILDPRDLKFCRNQCTASWDAKDDPFRRRGEWGFARWGLAELILLGGGSALISLVFLAATWICPWSAIGAGIFGILAGLFIWFFRDPHRVVPGDPDLFVSPADGRICEITRLENDPFIDGPAIRIGIFLSIFNVHLNRAPAAGRVLELRYHPGPFLNALDPTSAWKNENMWIGLEEPESPYRRVIVRAIAGAYARRIVCELRPGEYLERGQKIGMIKLGSRTELILPDLPELRIETKVGERVKAGTSILARFAHVDVPDSGASPVSPV
ncbi:MAG: phosphatidylserine decarboxylase [Planctomycetia bacterium]|nr:phosphatidylserine decarboxylase [Planctomycetia bacterium]